MNCKKFVSKKIPITFSQGCSSYKIHVTYLYIWFKITLLTHRQSYDCPSATKVTQKDMGESDFDRKPQQTTKKR